MSLQSHMPWQDGKSLKDAASHLYMKTALSDVEFTFSKEVNVAPIPAHKFILAMRSSEFENMFYNSSSSPSTVDITEVKREMFLPFLKFIYTDEIALTNNIVLHILYLSYRYQVVRLSNLSKEHLLNNIYPNTVCSIMEISEKYKMSSLQTECLTFIDENTSAVLQDINWLSLSLENMKLVLSRDGLSSTEKEIFEAVMKWASEECKQQGVDDTGKNRRAVLGDALYQIRIPTMSLEDYSQVVIKSGVLTDNEQLAIFKHLAPGSVEEVQNFVMKPRGDRKIIIELKSATKKSMVYDNAYELSKTCNMTISLKSRKTIKSMEVHISNIKSQCMSFMRRGSRRCLTDGVIAFVIQIESNGENRETNLTESEGPITVNFVPPICLTSGQHNSDKLSHHKSDSKHVVRIFLYRKNCPTCGRDRCQQMGNGTEGLVQDKGIQVSFGGLDLVQSITFI